MAVTRQHVSCGLDLHCVGDLSSSLQTASEAGFQFVIVPIAHPRYRREFISGKAKDYPGPFTRSDLLLNTQDWNSLVVGKISPWLDPDSPIHARRKNSEKALEQELSYAAHLGLPAVLLSLQKKNCVNLARCIYNKILSAASYQGMFQVWIHVPMESSSDQCKLFCRNSESCSAEFTDPFSGDRIQSYPADINELGSGDSPQSKSAFGLQDLDCEKEEQNEDTWEWWNTFRTVCNTDKKLGLALELSADLPSDEEIERWLGEPVRCIYIPTSLFLTNKKNYPVLSRAHQSLIRRLYKLDVQVVIRGITRHNNIKRYQQYMDHLWTNQVPDDALTQFARGYEDYLQVPLQPLMDNLESCTYEVFEKDPVKYTEYRKAMYQALLDKVNEDEKDAKVLVIMVVGAGRGPLVRAALVAAEAAGRKIRVYAVEKNPNAVVTLQVQKEEQWGDLVTVVSCDMREWEPPEKADILISELLGSFGDNELSPECLDGAQKFLKEDGVSIPATYTSYISPIHSPKLYSEVASMRERYKHPLAHFEMPYVVRLHNRTQLAPPQSLFTFHHPNKDEVIDNTRYEKLTFDISYNCTVHGFAGYFDTVLYKDITLSIVPETHSEGMFSWFPIFFPIKDPMYLNAGSKLEVHFWRCASHHNVWYEWCITQPYTIPIHNPNGRSYTIGL